jgi:stage V sporulation protein SpoVS
MKFSGARFRIKVAGRVINIANLQNRCEVQALTLAALNDSAQ